MNYHIKDKIFNPQEELKNILDTNPYFKDVVKKVHQINKNFFPIEWLYPKRILEALSLCLEYGFEPVNFLGQGKDSIVLSVKKNETLYIFKSLSEHALKYLSIMKSINKVNSKFLIKIDIIDDKFYLCKNLNTNSPNNSPEKCLECIKILCDLQIDLLSNDFLMWDYGTKQPNYLSTDDGLKIVDYGGGGFINIKNTKYNKKFVQYSLLLHFMLIGLGKTEVEKLIVIIKNFEFSKNHDELIFSLFRGTYYENLCKETLAIDFFKIDGWMKFKKILDPYIDNNDIKVQEASDISDVRYINNEYHITGYQNFIIKNDKVKPLNLGHSWAKSNEKWDIIKSIYENIKFNTFVDIGSNLGLYVFTAHLKNPKNITSIGVDYNSDYINVCNNISERLNLNCKFETNLFKNVTGEYDVVQMLGIIHHIFIRTEQNNSFKTIFKKINSITKRYLIIEFPTENDPKAKKWTNIPSRNKMHYYNQEIFLHEAKKYFSDIKLIDNTTIHRPIYLMVK